MDIHAPCFFFDVVDPLSFLSYRALTDTGLRVAAWPLELRPPPAPLVAATQPPWRDRWSAARTIAGAAGVPLRTPELVPWSRKAHEFVLHAKDQDSATDALRVVFEAFHTDGRDVGRIDVLVELARSLGLDATHAKAVLDVDRYEADIRAAGDWARARGISGSPALFDGSSTVEGFHNPAAIRTFLAATSHTD
jgi:predicted DsbA family dithiol-disulfide isomerase